MEDRKSTEQLSLHTVGDMELWIAKGKEWALPVHINWLHDKKNNKHYAQVTPAVALYNSQSKVMTALLGHHDISDSTSKWIIPRKIAEAILHKAPGVTPGFYYSWPDANCPPLSPQWGVTRLRARVAEPIKSWACESFVKHVAAARNIPASVVKLVLNAIGDEASSWMVEHRKPLELGFCRLIAVPFRANWKEIVMFKCRKWSLRELFGKPDKYLWSDLEKLGLPGILCSPHNIGLKRSIRVDGGMNRINYTIEAIPSEPFNNACNVLEAKRMALGHTSYVSSFEGAVEKLYYHIVHALGNYVKKVSVPFARVHVGRSTGIIRFLPVGAKKVEVRNVGLGNLPVHIIPPDSGFTVLAEGSDERLVQAQVDPVPKVPFVSQSTKNMRRCTEQRLLDTPINRQTGANGVPMLDAYQGEDPGGPVLPIATIDTTTPRMD